MAERGGKREGAGRKPKADELKIIEAMDAVLAPESVWASLADLVTAKDVAAIKLWLSYRFGMPRQQTDITTNGETIQQITVMTQADAQELEKI